MILLGLLRAGAKTDIADAQGKTPLVLAQQMKANALIEYLTNGPPPDEEPAAAAEGA